MESITSVSKSAPMAKRKSKASSKVLPGGGLTSMFEVPRATANETVSAKPFKPGSIGIYFLGIAVTLWGQFFSWNSGLTAGVYSFIIVYLVVGLAYVAFCLCMAEVTSTLPFAGGAFGLARSTLGFFPAFLIGCCEAFEYAVTVAVVAVETVKIAALSYPSLDGIKPLVWLAYFVPATILHCVGGAPFWWCTIGGGAIVLVLLLVYCFGALGDVSFQANALAEPSMLFVGGLQQVMVVFPSLAWFFLGIEALNLASDDVENPRIQIPRAQVACVCTLFVTGLFTLLVTVSLPTVGGIASIASALAPLNNGFRRIFNVEANVATLLLIPSQVGGVYGLTWASAKLLYSMGASKLLPPWLAAKSARFGTPYAAIITSTTISYVICLVVHYIPKTTTHLLSVCLLFAFSSYSGQCIGYISLRLQFPIASQRRFKNPLGIYGAVYALAVWVIGIIAILGFQGHGGVEFDFLVVTLALLAFYYVLFAKRRQVMSEEETKVLMVAHIALLNQRRRFRYVGASRLKSTGIRRTARRLTRMLRRRA